MHVIDRFGIRAKTLISITQIYQCFEAIPTALRLQKPSQCGSFWTYQEEQKEWLEFGSCLADVSTERWQSRRVGGQQRACKPLTHRIDCLVAAMLLMVLEVGLGNCFRTSGDQTSWLLVKSPMLKLEKVKGIF